MKPNTAVFLIILWSLTVHFPGLFSPLMDYHAYRQCQTSSVARNYVRHGMHFLSPEVDTEGVPRRTGTEFPIYSYLLALLYQAFGVHEILGRLLSCLFAAWGALYLYFFVRPRMGLRVAFWSALIMCSIPVHVYFTRSVQPEPMALWGLLGFLYYADRWLHRGGESVAWTMALSLGSLAPLLKLPYLYLLFPLWGFLGYERFGWRAMIHAKWLSLIALVFVFTGAWYAYARTAPVVLLPLTRQEHLANLAPIFTQRLWQAQFISRIPELVTTYSGLFFAVIGIYSFRNAKSFRLFFLWTLASVSYVALLGEYGLIHRYTLLPLAPVAAIWIAYGLSTLWEYAKLHGVYRFLVILLVIGIPLHAALRIKHWYRLEYSYLYRAHDTLAHISRPQDLVLVASHEKPELLYYLDRYGYAIEPNPFRPEEISSFLHRGVRFIFIPVDDNRKNLAEWKTYMAPRGKLIQVDPDYLLYSARQG